MWVRVSSQGQEFSHLGGLSNQCHLRSIALFKVISKPWKLSAQVNRNMLSFCHLFNDVYHKEAVSQDLGVWLLASRDPDMQKEWRGTERAKPGMGRTRDVQNQMLDEEN